MPHQDTSELTPAEREEQRRKDSQELAELAVEAMEALVRSGEWDPREGITGLERLLARDDETSPSQPA